MREDNRGFSLVEIIVIIGIIAVVSAGSISLFGYLSSKDVKKCASAINSCISTAKTHSMKDVDTESMFLYKYQGEYYVKYDKLPSVSKNADGEKVGGSNMTVSFTNTAGVSTVLTDGTEPVRISFSRKDGHFTAGPQSILVSCDGVSKEIYLVTETGKHFVR